MVETDAEEEDRRCRDRFDPWLVVSVGDAAVVMVGAWFLQDDNKRTGLLLLVLVVLAAKARRVTGLPRIITNLIFVDENALGLVAMMRVDGLVERMNEQIMKEWFQFQTVTIGRWIK